MVQLEYLRPFRSGCLINTLYTSPAALGLKNGNQLAPKCPKVVVRSIQLVINKFFWFKNYEKSRWKRKKKRGKQGGGGGWGCEDKIMPKIVATYAMPIATKISNSFNTPHHNLLSMYNKTRKIKLVQQSLYEIKLVIFLYIFILYRNFLWSMVMGMKISLVFYENP